MELNTQTTTGNRNHVSNHRRREILQHIRTAREAARAEAQQSGDYRRADVLAIVERIVVGHKGALKAVDRLAEFLG